LELYIFADFLFVLLLHENRDTVQAL